MSKFLVGALAAGTMVLTAGATRSWADTITFNNSSIHPDGSPAMGDTVSLTDGVADAMDRILPLVGFGNTCGPVMVTCPELDPATPGSDGSTGATDFGYTGPGPITVMGAMAPLGLLDTGGLTGTLSPVTLDAAVDTASAVNPGSLGSGDQSLLTQLTDAPLATSGTSGNTDQIVVDTPLSIAAVPESGSLILVGIGLVAGARYLRRPNAA